MSTLTKGVLAVALLYLVWHLGRWYELNQARQYIENVGKNTVDAEFIIPDDLPYAGEIAVGNCVTGDSWYHLFQYGGFVK